VTTDEIIDHLYDLPPGEFTSARNDAERALRKEGKRAEAARVKELRKPTAAAAAVNRLVRRHRTDVERFLAGADVLRRAQLEGKGDLAAATLEEREALASLVRVGGEPVRQSLQAAAVDGEAARQLLEARLDRELEPGGFGTLLVDAPRPRGRPRKQPRTAAPAKRDDRAARARLREAREALAGAQAHERRAHKDWKQAEAGVKKAEAAVVRAEEKLAEPGTRPTG